MSTMETSSDNLTFANDHASEIPKGKKGKRKSSVEELDKKEKKRREKMRHSHLISHIQMIKIE